jgi:ADP-heptose:LPS heptosyltransferase/GT2 family glycosyltransferase
MKFSYIVPTYRQVELNETCLKSLREFHPHSDVILVSDGDNKNTQLKLKKICDKYGAKLLCSFWNNYFAHSVNRGMDAAVDSDVVVLCNNDIIFTQNIEEETQNIFENDPLIGVVGYLLYYPNGRIQHGGMKRLTHTHLFAHHDHGSQVNEADKSLISRYSIGCTGALLSIRRDLINEIGVMKTGGGIANEDTEFCLRTWHCGYRIYYTADVSAIHAEGYTRGRTPTEKKKTGLDQAEILSGQQLKEDCKRFDIDNIEKRISELNGDEYTKHESDINFKKKRIGLTRTNALGDCICLTGIINKLKTDNPNSEIYVATKEPWPFENNPTIKGIVDDKKYIKNHADEIIDLDLCYEKEPHKPIWKSYADKVFGENNYNEFDIKPYLFTERKDRMSLLIKLKKEKAFIGSNYVVIHAGGNTWEERIIDKDIWTEVFDYLIVEKKYKVVVVGKKGDLEYQSFLFAKEKTQQGFNLIDKLTLTEIHQLIINAEMFIGIDSGILHIAQCTNTKLIGIFTVADPTKRIHRQHFTKVVEPVSECKYCLTYKIKPPVTTMKCETGNMECKKSITADMIIEAVKSFDIEDNNADGFAIPKELYKELMGNKYLVGYSPDDSIKLDTEYFYPTNTPEEREQAYKEIIENDKNNKE